MAKMAATELTDWIAFYELQQEDEQKAIDDAKNGR